MTDLLKKSLKALYADSPEILYLLDQINYDTLNVTWEQEIYARVSKEVLDEVEAFLVSDKYLSYANAINGASLAMTRPLLELMQFITAPKEGETN